MLIKAPTEICMPRNLVSYPSFGIGMCMLYSSFPPYLYLVSSGITISAPNLPSIFNRNVIDISQMDLNWHVNVEYFLL